MRRWQESQRCPGSSSLQRTLRDLSHLQALLLRHRDVFLKLLPPQLSGPESKGLLPDRVRPCLPSAPSMSSAQLTCAHLSSPAKPAPLHPRPYLCRLQPFPAKSALPFTGTLPPPVLQQVPSPACCLDAQPVLHLQILWPDEGPLILFHPLPLHFDPVLF